MEKAKAIVITGTPGVGKSTLARLLAEELGAELISLGELVAEEGLHEGEDPETGSLLVDLGALSKRLVELLSHGQRELYVVEGHYAHLVVPREFLLMAFVLRREPGELKRILEARGYSGRKLYENLQAEVLDVCLYEAVQAYGPELVYEVDTTGRELRDVLEEVLRALERGRGRVGIVDWLGALEGEGRLSDFFPPEQHQN